MESWDREVSEAERRKLDEHLAECSSCRQEAAELETMWLRLGDLDGEVAVPSERMRSRFYGFLAEQQHRGQRLGTSERLAALIGSFWPSRSRTQMAAAAAALFFGVVLGFALAGARSGGEVRALRDELASVSENVGLSLLTHPSASERLRGVSLTGRAESDERVVSALLDLVRNDPNVNVRLAAIDALAMRLEHPGVKPRLLGTLPEQRSPILQMTLLDVLLPVGGEEVLEVAEPMLQGGELDEAVRERLLEAKGDPA